ncbi:unnamed protein product [Candida verbasci]|uniref:Genetic interactor of prohibitin 5, mitochondrial n=1 Tax=Candida verbasci TaxID=1227364 RepID=A0A9W4TZL3_9ASCO|nr:unnamed protein product [Candida verbasci]
MSYKLLQRQLRRLPIPRNIILDGSRTIKHLYLNEETKHLQSIFNEILNKEQYRDGIPKLLDLIYINKPYWLIELDSLKYTKFKGYWPEVHLIEELTNNKYLLDRYYGNYQKSFSVVKFMGEKPNETLPLITRAEKDHHINEVVNNAKNAFKLIISNKTIFEVSKRPFEVLYFPSKLGKIEYQKGREIRFKNKIKYVKELLNKFPPMEKSQLIKLFQSINQPITPNFYKHLRRRRANYNKIDRDVLNLIMKVGPVSDQDFHEIFQTYSDRQYTYSEGNYIIYSNLKTV